jgi:diguanylate cyclase (GGDEF)-like protein/PAS domain S-box-containing protein
MTIQVPPLAGASRSEGILPRPPAPRLLVSLAAGVILVSGLLLAAALAYLYQQTLHNGNRLAASWVQVIAEQTGRTLQTVDQQLQLAQARLALRQVNGPLDAARARALLRENLAELPYLRAIWVLDAKGRIAQDTDVGNLGVDLSDRPYFQVFQTAPETTLYIGNRVRSRTTGGWFIAVARPLRGADGQLSGVIVAGLDPAYFEASWASVDQGEGGSVALLRKSGELVMRNPYVEASVGRSFADQPLFTTHLPVADAGVYYQTSPLDGQLRQFAYRTLAQRPDLIAVVGQPRSVVLAPWRHAAALALFIWVLASAAVATLGMLLHRAMREGRRADAERVQAAKRLTLATEVASIGVWDWDVQTDDWYASPTYFTMLGYVPVLGPGSRQQWLERVHPDDRAGIAAKIAAIQSDPNLPYQYEARMRHADGSYHWVEVVGRVLARDAAGQVARLLGVRLDISARKRAEEDRLRVFERITDAFVALDRVVQLLGQHLWTEVPAIDSEALRRATARALVDQTPVAEEMFVAPLGRWFEHRIYPSPDGVTVYFHDVSERRQAEEHMRLSEESLAITLQSIGDAVVATDTQGLVTRMNRTAERLTGWPLEEALGRPLDHVFRIVNAQSRGPMVSPVALVLERGDVVGLANHTALLSRDGTEYQIADSGAPIRNAAGQVVGVVLVFSDVTESYRVRQALATSVELLERTGEIAKVGGWDLDLATGHCFWTRETCFIHEVEPGFTPTLAEALAFYTPESRPKVQAAVAHSMATGEPWDLELQITTARGRAIWVRAQGFAVFEDGRVQRLRGAFHDLTERRQAEADLRAASERTQTILDNMIDGVISIDASGAVQSFNRAASEMFGYSAEEVMGHDLTMLMPAEYRERHGEFLRMNLASPPSALIDTPGELEGLRKDGSVFPMSLALSRNTQADAVSFIGVVRDITQQREDMEEIRRLAFFDLLTGLPNRRLLMDRLRQAMVTSTRTGEHGALMLLDLDHFKLLNDSAGHDVGDVLLQQVAQRLQDCVRDSDSVARLGGDEFVVLLEALSVHGHEAATQAELIANKILEAFKAGFMLRDQAEDSTTSIGIVVFRGDSEGMDDLLKKADVAMYQAKSAGRNNARFFDPAMQAAVAAHEALEKDLRRGLATQEFLLHYQVQIDRAGQPTGAEALVRWRHPGRGMVTPARFIPLAEETGLILPLGQWVLETACAQLVAWSSDSATARWSMAVNVSASQFAQANFVAHVKLALGNSGADPRLLKLELTESMLVGDMEDVIRKMTELKAEGVGFSLDDFGTGYSSLSYLKRLPLDQLKIDQSFVRDVLSDASDAVIARTIVALGQSLGLRVIAEGVETSEQRDFLTEIGCDGFQGYFFGRPGPVQDLAVPGDAGAANAG